VTEQNPYQARFAAAVATGLLLSILLVVTSLVEAAASVPAYF
jgi:hypothetical protein